MNSALLNSIVETNKKDGSASTKLSRKTSFIYATKKRKQSLSLETKRSVNPVRKRSLPLDGKIKRPIDPNLRAHTSSELKPSIKLEPIKKLSSESLSGRKPHSPDAGPRQLSRSSSNSIKFKRPEVNRKYTPDKSENVSLRVIHEGALLQESNDEQPSSSHASTSSLKSKAPAAGSPNNLLSCSPAVSPTLPVLKKSESQRFFSSMNMSTSISENYLELVLRRRLEQSDAVMVAHNERRRKVSMKSRAVRGAATALILALVHAAFYLPAGVFGLAFYKSTSAGADPRLISVFWACYLFAMCWSSIGSLVNIFLYIVRIPAFRKKLISMLKIGRKRRKSSARQFSELTPSGSSYYF